MVAYWLNVLESLCWKFSDYCTRKITNFTCFGYYCDKRGYEIQCLVLENLRTIWGGLTDLVAKKFENLTLGPNPKTSEETFRKFNDTRGRNKRLLS
jgi:hypothetical protein